MKYDEQVPAAAIYGLHYLRHGGRVVPIVAGGDGPVADDGSLAALIRLVEQAENTDTLSGLAFELDDEGHVSGGELFELRQALLSGFDETRPSVTSREGLADLTRVQQAIATVDARLGAVEAEAATLADELALLDAAVHGSPGDGAPDPENPNQPAPEVDPAAPEGEPPAGDAPPAAGDPPAPDAGAATPPEGDPAPAGGDAPAPEGGDTVSAGATPRPRPSMTALQRVQRPESRPAAQRPDADHPARHEILAFAGLQNIAAGQAFGSREVLGDTIRDMAPVMSVQRPSESGRKYLGIIRAIRPAEGESSRLVFADDHDGMDSEGIINLAVERARDLRVQAATLQASGGICIPPTPDYRIDIVGDRGTPFVETLPTIVSARPLQYFPWLEFDINSAPLATGIGHVTASQDAVGYGGLNPFTGETDAIPGGGVKYKDCVRIDCPEPQTCELEAIYRCVTVGRFMAVTWAEYVRVFDEWTGIYFDVKRDSRAMAKVLAAASNITAGPATFGATRDLLGRIRQLVAHVRSARHAPSMAFRVYLPWYLSAELANDLAFSFAQGVENLRITPQQALALLAVDEGIIVDTYNISAGATADGSPTVLPLPADGSPLPAWPTQARLLIWADGAVFHQQSGEVKFGLEEVGMHTNDFSTFEETLETTCPRGSDIYTLDVDLCDSGAIGASVAKVCGNAPGLVNEIQFLDPDDATAGAYTADFDGTDLVLPWDASAATALAVFLATPAFNPGDVSISKVGTRLFVQFTGQYAGQDVPAFVLDQTGLTGGPALTGVIQNGG